LTFDARNASPAWSADGQTIYYSEIDPTAKTTLMRKPADGSREAEAITTFGNTTYLKAVMPDGTSAIFDEQMNTNRGNILRSDLAQDAQPTPLVNTAFNEYAAALSPDGRLLAYQSNESGRHEIYVRDISGAGGRWQVSTEGGEEPHWSHDDRELYFRNNDIFMGAAVDTKRSFKADTPQKLFSGTFNLRSNSGVSYDVNPRDGRFLMIRPAEDYAAVAQVQVVLNWFEELRRLAPAQ
jgi:serine/threonine-protein kinase